MARKIKWRLQFKSFNNTGCLVNIYEEGYTNSQADTTKTGANVPFAVETGVTELTGGAVPFEIEEDDSSNLTDFIRIKTGYLRVIETSYGDLNDLFPTSIRHHFVEVFYSSERVFTGFMQCQEFDNPWVAAPRELEFACVSPLGLLDAFNFSIPNDHGLVTLGKLLHEVMVGLNPSATDNTVSDYQNVIYPTEEGTSASVIYAPWNNKINSTVIIPFNPDFEHYDYTAQNTPVDLWSPKSYQYFLDGICKCFGWMVHDTPSGLVFIKYDNTGSMYMIPVSNLTSLSGAEWLLQMVDSFGNYYSNVDDNAQQNMVMPAKQVTLQLEGADIGKKELTTKHAIANEHMTGGGTYRSVAMEQIGPDVTADYIGKALVGTDGYIFNKGTFPLAFGKIETGDVSVSLDDAWVIRYDSSWTNGANLIYAKLFGNPPRSVDGYCLLKLKMERGSSLQNMQQSGYDSITMNLVIKIDGMYYNITNGTLSSSVVYNAITIDGSKGKVTPNTSLGGPDIGLPNDIGDVDGIMFNVGYAVRGAVEIGLYKSGSTVLNDGDILRIMDLSLNDPGHIDEAYRSYYDKRSEIVVGNNQTGTETCEITVPFNNYDIRRGENSICSTTGNITGNNPTYPYMLRPLHLLTERVKRTSNAITFNEYAAKWTYWINGWRWRMIAKNFNLRDDEYTITLARSSSIE